MKKAIMISSVLSMIVEFNLENIKILKKLGYEVEVLTNTKVINTSKSVHDNYLKTLKKMKVKVLHCDIQRQPFDKLNLNAFVEMREIINNGNYDLVHCYSPVGGVLARFASLKSRKKGMKVIYTAHGFQFYRGGAIKNWILYYPIEKLLSFFTDVLITVNTSDYKESLKFFSKKKEYIPGAGISLEKFKANLESSIEVEKTKLGLKADDFVILSVGELNKNKNHGVVINAISSLNFTDIHYLICGIGEEQVHLEELAKEKKIDKKVSFLGYREDVELLCKISNVFLFPSMREGLGLAAIEAMAAGLPIITSNVHGINDYSINGITGFSYSPTDVRGFSTGISLLYKNLDLAKKMGSGNVKRATKFDIENVNTYMENIYLNI